MTSPAPYQPGDRIALVRTEDPGTRLRPGDEGTVTRWDPAHGQFSDHEAGCNSSELQFYVAYMSATLVRGRLCRVHRGPPSGTSERIMCCDLAGVVAVPLRLDGLGTRIADSALITGGEAAAAGGRIIVVASG